MSAVVDASVMVKCFFPEDYSKEAITLIEHADRLLVPDLLFAEVGSVIWKRVRSKEITSEEADLVVGALDSFPCELEVVPSRELLTSALAIAIQSGATVYDSLYLALAIREELPLITADRKFHAVCAGTPLAEHVLWIGEEAA